MGNEEICNTGLVLGFCCHGEVGNGFKWKNHEQKNQSCFEFDQSSPTEGPDTSLSLGLTSIEISKSKACEQVQEVGQSSPRSTVTSFSNTNQDITSMKRERDAGSEDVEFERVSSRASDEDDEGSGRKKLRLTKEQSALLENYFKENTTLHPKQKQALAVQLNLRPRQVEVWFQNRRARTKLKQTEVDCEYLRRYCETLKEENRRLQRELHELKTLKLSSPVYMAVPPATLTVCPSCERLGSGSSSSSNRPFSAGPRSRQFLQDNPFSHHQSTAC